MKNQLQNRVENSEAGFIYHVNPYICQNIPFIFPFICNNRPSVGIEKKRGFTLIELMVTLVLAAIIVFIAVPNMRSFVQYSRIKGQTSELVSALNLARSSAIKNKVRTMVCERTSGNCTGALWNRGWSTWLDPANFNVIDAGETVLYQSESVSDQKIEVIFASVNSWLRFRPDGTTSATATFSICDGSRNGEEGRLISIAITGRTSVSKYPCT